MGNNMIKSDCTSLYVMPQSEDCKRVLDYMEEQGLTFRTFDVTRDFKMRARIESAEGVLRVPLLVDENGSHFGAEAIVNYLANRA